MIEVQYRLTAPAGRADPLGAALLALAADVGALPGCRGAHVLRDAADAVRFLFVERWGSREAQQDAGRALGPEAFVPILALSAGKPERSVLRAYAA